MIHWIRSLDRVLKGEMTTAAVLNAGTIPIPAGGLTFLIVVLGGFYGLCMGTFSLITHWGGGGTTQGLTSFFAACTDWG